MDEQTQTEFLGWIAENFKLKSHEEIEMFLKKAGPKGIKSYLKEFQNQKGIVSKANGGKLDYIKKLNEYSSTINIKKECTICDKIKLMKR